MGRRECHILLMHLMWGMKYLKKLYNQIKVPFIFYIKKAKGKFIIIVYYRVVKKFEMFFFLETMIKVTFIFDIEFYVLFNDTNPIIWHKFSFKMKMKKILS